MRGEIARGDPTPAPRVLVAIPAFNEEATISNVIGEVSKVEVVEHVVVVDDGSHDHTAAVARSLGVTVLNLPFNVGVGGAMRAAFLYARDFNFDYVVQVDADGQHDPSEIDKLLEAAGDASVVIGARFAGDGDYRVSMPRRWAMQMLAFSLSRVARTRLTDTTSGFRLSDRRAIEVFARHYPAEYLGDTVESLVIASRTGLAITQVPVSMRPRQGGQATQSRLSASMYLGRAMLALFVSLTRWRGNGNLLETAVARNPGASA